MSNRLPEQVELQRLASQNEQLKGTIALSKMLRLIPLLTTAEGDVSVELHFKRNEAGLVRITGRVSSAVMVICQRCMQPMQMPIETKVALGMIRNLAQAERLPAGIEPLLVEDEYTSLTELVEDELLLALPVAPIHELDQCPARDIVEKREQAQQTGGAVVQESRQAQVSEKPNPFAVLAELKKSGLKKK